MAGNTYNPTLGRRQQQQGTQQYQQGQAYQAQQRDAVPQGYRDLQDQQWQQAQQGQQRAQGYLDPAWNYAQGYAQRGPGAFENAYPGLSAQLQGQGQTGNAWGYVQGQLQQPLNTAGAFTSLENYTNRPSAASEVYGSFQMPGSSAGYYNQHQGFFNQPGAGQGLSDQFTTQMRQPGTGENWQQQNQGFYNQPTSSGRLYEQNYGGFGTAGASEDLGRYDKYAGQMGEGYAKLAEQRDRLSGASATEKAGTEIGGTYREAGNLARGAQATERFAGSQLPGLGREGIGEQFARTALEGGNPYLQRQTDQGMKRINQELARRGHFDSGGAGTAIGNYLAAQDAEQFKYMGDITAQGQRLGNERVGLGTSVAQASDTGTLNRGRGIADSGQNLQSLSGQQDQERMAREGLQAQIQQAMMGMQQGDRQFDLQAAGRADDTRMRRLQGMGDLAGQRDQLDLNKMNAGGDMAFRSQGMGLDRMGAAFGMGNAQDRYNLDRTMSGMNMAGMNDDQYLRSIGMRGNLAGQFDDNRFRSIMGQGTLAGQAQGFERDRMLDGYNMLMGAGGAMAGNVGNYWGMGMDAYGQGMSDSLNARQDRYLMDRMLREQNQDPGVWETILGVGGGAIGAYYGGPQGAQAGYNIGRGSGGYIDRR